MTDYGHELRFGLFPTPYSDDPDRVVELAQLADQVGLDLVAIQDHPYTPELLEAWTLLSVIAARTQSVRVTLDVGNLPFRHPVVLARSVASLGLLTGGRVDLGLGAGGFSEPAVANGVPRRSTGERVEALDEAIRIIRKVWAPTGGGIRFDGKHFQMTGAKRGPVPVGDPEILVGAMKPRMLRLVGRLADGWMMPNSGVVGPDQTEVMNKTIDDAALEAGRDPADVRRLYNLFGRFGSGAGFVQGSEKDWIEQLTELTLSQGIGTYIFGGNSADDVHRFADIAAGVREAVASARAGGSVPAAPASASATIPASSGFSVTPTPDDGVRRSTQRLWDESARPIGPARDADRVYTASEEAKAAPLVEIHDHLRSELSQIHSLVEQVAAGEIGAGEARSELNTMTMRQNNWTLGTYCESYCRLVTMHHGVEDAALFPQLRRADPRLAPVVDRLQQEHRVIHDVLERVDRALIALVDGTGDLDGLRHTVDIMSDTLLSHLAYEERELLEPLARIPVHP